MNKSDHVALSESLNKYFIDTVQDESINHKKMWEFFIKYISNTDSFDEEAAEKLLNETMFSMRDWMH
jgi:predicted ATP-dependent protease